MFLMPLAESFAMWTISCIVSCVTAHETSMFLFLVVIHSLCHPQRQSLYVVSFGWYTLHLIRVRWEQVCFYSSCVPDWGRILLVTLRRVMSQSSSSGCVLGLMACLQFLGQMVESIKASVCLFSLQKIGHSKAERISEAQDQPIVEVISSQAFSFIFP